MAQLNGIYLTGSLILSNSTQNISCVGYLWFTGSCVAYSFSSSIPTWTSGGSLINARLGAAGAGTQNLGLAFGGQGSAPGQLNSTEEYNGTSWSNGGTMICGRAFLAGAGTQNEALAFGGYVVPPAILSCTEQYNGTTWTAGGTLITARFSLGGAGILNAAIAFGGSNPALLNSTEEYNGSTWSSGGNSNIGSNKSGFGTQNSAISTTGYNTEEYNGTSWSIKGCNLYFVRNSAGAGISNAGLSVGGYSPSTYCVGCLLTTCYHTQYDGFGWTQKNSLINGRAWTSAIGTQNEALVFGGSSSGNSYNALTCTEEWAALNCINTRYLF